MKRDPPHGFGPHAVGPHRVASHRRIRRVTLRFRPALRELTGLRGLILSKNAIASDWAEDEISNAFAEENRKRKVVPFPVRIAERNAQMAYIALLFMVMISITIKSTFAVTTELWTCQLNGKWIVKESARVTGEPITDFDQIIQVMISEDGKALLRTISKDGHPTNWLSTTRHGFTFIATPAITVVIEIDPETGEAISANIGALAVGASVGWCTK